MLLRVFLMSIFVFLATSGFTITQTNLEKGKVIDSIRVNENTNETYALYLPTSFNANEPSSIVFIYEPAARGKGLGKEVMVHIWTFAKAENCINIQWQTPDFNEQAIGFYKKLGAVSKTKERFFWLVENEVL